MDDTTTSPLPGDVVSAGLGKKDTAVEDLEINESDSDDSDTDDDAPLAEVAQKAKDKMTNPVAQDEAAETKPSPAVTDSQDRAKSSFDDIFGPSDTPDVSAQVPDATSSPEASKSSSSPFDIPTVIESPTSSKPTDVAGVNAFDEALGSFSPPPSAAPARFAFEGFEDSFDFGGAEGHKSRLSLNRQRL